MDRTTEAQSPYRRRLLQLSLGSVLGVSGCLRLTEPGGTPEAGAEETVSDAEADNGGSPQATSATATQSQDAVTESSTATSQPEPTETVSPTPTPTSESQDSEPDSSDSPPAASVTLNDQESDGTRITVAKVETDGEAIVQLYDGNREYLANPGIRFQPGDVREDINIRLEDPISETQTISVRVFWCEESGPNTCNGPDIARDSATVTIV